jgi:hypothetical protein
MRRLARRLDGDAGGIEPRRQRAPGGQIVDQPDDLGPEEGKQVHGRIF